MMNRKWVLLVIVFTILQTVYFSSKDYENNRLKYKYGWLHFEATTYQFYVDDAKVMDSIVFLNFELKKITYGDARTKYEPHWKAMRNDTLRLIIRSALISLALLVLMSYLLKPCWQKLLRFCWQKLEHYKQQRECIRDYKDFMSKPPDEVEQNAPPVETITKADAPVSVTSDNDDVRMGDVPDPPPVDMRDSPHEAICNAQRSELNNQEKDPSRDIRKRVRERGGI